jgi:amidase
LRSLGHELTERDPDYGLLLPDIMPLYLAGVADDEARLEHPERLEPRTRQMAAIGRRVHGRALQRGLHRQPIAAARINGIFTDHDVLLTAVTAAQPALVGKWKGKGPVRTFYGSGPYVTYTAVWNYLGYPAAAVPAGFDEAGMPTAVQLVAPSGGETTLLSLAGQIERARPWAHNRPPIPKVTDAS